MKENKVEILRPTYMKDFKCIGGACEDTCCKGWQVAIDQSTYELYCEIRHPELKEMIESNININENDKSTPMDYAHIILTEETQCPFLDANGWCKIQKEFGENYLSVTCWLYPRQYNIINNKAEQAGVLSCPEVARKALLNSNGIEFERTMISYSAKDVTIGMFEPNKLKKTDINYYFWEIRIAGLNLLQNSDYKIGERLYLLGMLYENILELKTNLEIKNINELLDTFESMVSLREFDSVLESIPLNLQVKRDVVRNLMEIRLKVGITSERYLKCFIDTVNGLNLNLDGMDNYEIDRSIYNNFMSDNDYILENYLVSEYFREMMPVGKYSDIWESYIHLCIMYAMIQMHLLGMCNSRGSINQEMVVELIQSLSKEISHNQRLYEAVINVINNSGFNTLNYMAALTKDVE